MTQEDFNKTVIQKMRLYFEKANDPIKALKFLQEYLHLNLHALKQRVGTKEKMGTMRRFIDQE